jgi:Secretion system C-terminal sorting domain
LIKNFSILFFCFLPFALCGQIRDTTIIELDSTSGVKKIVHYNMNGTGGGWTGSGPRLTRRTVTKYDSRGNCEFVLGIGETTTTQVEVFPNPTSHVLNIQSKSLIHSIDIYDTTGCIVIARTPNATVTPVNTEELSSGIYLLVVTTAGGIIETMKLMKD